MDLNLKNCRQNPTIGHPQYQSNCKEYIFNIVDSLPICLRCNPDSIILLNLNNKCQKHTYNNCTNAYLNPSNSQKYDCNECSQGSYSNNKFQKCIKNPSPGQIGYIQHCKKYKLYTGKEIPECNKCVEGMFLHHIHKTCLNPTQNIQNCYKYEADGICEVCMPGYNLIYGIYCVYSTPQKKEEQIDDCVKYRNTGYMFQCVLCRQHYYLQNYKCIKVDTVIDNCTQYASSNQCHICNAHTHYTSYQNKNCILCPPRESNLEAAGTPNSNSRDNPKQKQISSKHTQPQIIPEQNSQPKLIIGKQTHPYLFSSTLDRNSKISLTNISFAIILSIQLLVL